MNNLLQKLGSDLKKTDRKTENVTARYAVFYKLRMDGVKLAAISRLSGYHHATIVHGVTQFGNWIKSNDKLAVEYWNRIKDDDYSMTKI